MDSPIDLISALVGSTYIRCCVIKGGPEEPLIKNNRCLLGITYNRWALGLQNKLHPPTKQNVKEAEHTSCLCLGYLNHILMGWYLKAIG